MSSVHATLEGSYLPDLRRDGEGRPILEGRSLRYALTLELQRRGESTLAELLGSRRYAPGRIPRSTHHWIRTWMRAWTTSEPGEVN
jgi:hypothetical protein